MTSHAFPNQVPGHDQHLFRGQRQVFAGIERCQGWTQGGAACGGHDHQVDLGILHGLFDGTGRGGLLGPLRMREQGLYAGVAAGDGLQRGGIGAGDGRA